MTYCSEIKSVKGALLTLAFGLAVIVFAFYLQLDPLALPPPIKRMLWRHPEAEGVIMLLAGFVSVVCLLFSVLILDIGFRVLFGRNRKGAFISVDADGLSVPNMVSGGQFWIPASEIIGVTESGGIVKVTYQVQGRQAVWELSRFFVNEPERFVESANELIETYVESPVDTAKNSGHYSVYFFSHKDERDSDKQVSILARLTKRSQDDIEKAYRSGGVEIKGGLTEDMANKLVLLLRKKFDIQAGIVSSEINKTSDDGVRGAEAKIKPMPIIAPTFATLVAILIIPGGLVIWLFFIKYLLERLGRKIEINPLVFLAAVLLEILLTLDMMGNFTTVIFVLGVVIAAGIYIGFGLKQSLEQESIAQLNPVFVALFSVPYVNHAVNKAILAMADNSR